MSFLHGQLLNLVIFVPVLFAGLLALLPSDEKGQIRVFTLIAMLVDFGLSLWAYLAFSPSGPEIQLETRVRWIPSLGVSFHTGVDGLAVSLILLTGLLGPIVVLSSWSFVKERVKSFHIALLILQTAMMGTLGALDLVLFYVFWESMLFPMYLLIGVWGSEERRMAAVKFFIYTMVGSLLMLVALLAVYFMAAPAGARSFDYATIYNGLLSATKEVSACVAAPGTACAHLSPLALALKNWGPWMFLAFGLAFAIKVPLFPVHTWLPDAHTQAPVAGSIVLAGVMLKMGVFGFWRYAIPLFPVAARQLHTFIAALAVIGIVYGAMMCLVQKDVKRLIAYSSVSHLGYCMLGIFALTAAAATGGAYQMLNHGISTGALFLLFGFVYERRHTRQMSDYGGIAKTMPIFAAAFVIIAFSSMAVPGTNGFVGEFLVLLGTFQGSLGWGFGAVASLGVILGAGYILLMLHRLLFGKIDKPENARLKDLGWRECIAAAPLVILVLVMGLMPQPFLNRLEPSVKHFIARAQYGTAGHQNLEAVRMNVMSLPPRTFVAQAPRHASASPSVVLAHRDVLPNEAQQ